MSFTLWLALAVAAEPEPLPTPEAPAEVAAAPSAPGDTPVEAQAPLAAARPPVAPTPSPALRSARAMTVSGKVLTSVGITTGVLSGGLAVWGAAMTPSCEFECMGPVFAFSGALIGVGITSVFLGAGVPLWVVGEKREHALSVPLSTLIVVPTAEPQGGGVAVAFQF